MSGRKLTYRMTSGEGIATIAGQATTDRVVVDHLALGGHSAGAGARISALLVRARFRQPAVRVDSALGAAGRWRAEEAGDTGTYRLAVGLAALAVGSAR